MITNCTPQHPQPAGTKRITDGTRRSERASRTFAGLAPNLAIGHLAGAVKRGGGGLGLTMREIMLIDTLLGYSRRQDWDPGHRPIVWPSNLTLATLLQIQIRQVQNLLAQLEAHGMLLRNSDGRRTGVRDPHGHIVTANGIDLSPLAQRYPDLLEAKARTCESTRRLQHLRQHTRQRYHRARYELLHAIDHGLDGHDWLAMLERVETMKPTTRHTLDEMENLHQSLDLMLADIATVSDEAVGRHLVDNTGDNQLSTTPPYIPPPPRSAPQGAIDCTHNTNTDYEKTIHTAVAPDGTIRPPPQHDQTHYAANREEALGIAWISVHTVYRISPAFRAWIANDPPTPERLAQFARHSLPETLGIPRNAWADAIRVLGHLGTIVSACVIDAKGAAIESRTSYLRAMVRRARTGQLHLGRSVHGLLRTDHATATAH